MKGILICNGYKNSEKFNTFYDFIVSSFNKASIDLKIVKNTEVPLIINKKPFNDNVDFILFFDKDISLAYHLEKMGYKVYNSAKAIEICDDKGKTHLELENDKNINMPKTLLIPFSFEKNFPSYELIAKEFSIPFIVKERKGSFGEQVYLVYSLDDWNRIILNSSCELLIQEYIDYYFHEDYRIYVVGDKVVGSFKRIGKDGDFRANVTLGGKMEVVSLPKEYYDMALYVSKKLGLSFAGLDFMASKNNKPVFIEANSNAHFINAYNISNINVADYIAEYIKSDLNK